MNGVTGNAAQAPAARCDCRPALAQPRRWQREKFLPVTRHALMDRLTRQRWPHGDAVQARRFMRYLDYWRRHSYACSCSSSSRSTSRSAPTATCCTRATFSAEERQAMQKRLVAQMADLLEQANFTRVDPPTCTSS